MLLTSVEDNAMDEICTYTSWDWALLFIGCVAVVMAVFVWEKFFSAGWGSEESRRKLVRTKLCGVLIALMFLILVFQAAAGN